MDSVDHVMSLISDLGSQSVSDISTEDKRSLLDFPEDEKLDASIKKCTSLSRTELLQRAATSPGQLTTAEIDVLREHYWLDISPTEARIKGERDSALYRAPSGSYEGTYNELKAVRAAFYAENEAEALHNAVAEHGRRALQARQAGLDREVETHLAKLGPDKAWIRQIWEEDVKDTGAWGYAAYVVPGAADSPSQWEEYDSYRSGRLLHAKIALGFGDRIGAKFSNQRLPWPAESNIETPNPTAPEDREHVLGNMFQKLREDFVRLRAVPHGVDEGRVGMRKGLLTNVFLVHDRETVNSVVGMSGLADQMWIWAVDPDYEPTSPDDYPEEYRGYFKVRLQQLLKNFYVARRFRSDEFSMVDLWDMARRSRDQTFISLDESEFQCFEINRTLGSALIVRPPWRGDKEP
ncbi:hypothetical protein PG996_011469 [Apiospora saccharicola]|uniref:Uncharacterized protein n=1 Tax=Apiospora saccharicola TaxID=335842 RepID=A0ABR1UFQ0_9PEZI